jgi:hypothetical protein
MFDAAARISGNFETTGFHFAWQADGHDHHPKRCAFQSAASQPFSISL